MKKIFFLMLVFIMLFSFTALANDDNGAETEVLETEDSSVQPRYTYLAFVSISLKIDETGYIEYNCSAGAPSRNVRLKLYLQRSRNQFLWDDIVGTIKTEYDTGRISETFNVQADDYFYRAKVVVEVLDDNKNIIETETAYSSTERY